MKLNLPSTWTSQKMLTLFLWTWININLGESGQGFKNCLAHYNNTSDYYNLLLNYNFVNNSAVNKGLVLRLCCTAESQCVSGLTHSCINNGQSFFLCGKVSQTIVCSRNQGDATNCGGIVGENVLIANSTVLGDCNKYNFTSIINYLTTVNPDERLSNNYANLYCPNNSPCDGLTCNWDNGGWTCSSWSYANCPDVINNDYFCYRNCTLQWPASFPGAGVPTPTSYNVPTTTIIKDNGGGIPAWEGALIGVGSSLATILTVIGIYLCWIKRAVTTVLLIPGS
jgi:hypothetical protein